MLYPMSRAEFLIVLNCRFLSCSWSCLVLVLMVVPFAVPYSAGVSREDGSENYSERTALQSKWTLDHELAEKKRRKVGPS